MAPEQSPVPEAAEVAIPPTEIQDRLYAFMSEHLGFAYKAERLFEAVFGCEYQPGDPQARQKRIYIQMMFLPYHSFGKNFIARASEDGKAVQLGHMFIDRGDPLEIRPKRRRLYRMHDVSEYSPSRDDGIEMHHGFWVRWEPAFENVEVVPREVPEYLPVDGLHKRTKRRGHRKNTVKTARDKDEATVSEEKTSDWLTDFEQSVVEAIFQREEENLMQPGEVPANAIRMMSSSAILGTKKQRERLFSAGLISRGQLSVGAPLTAEQLVLASLINPNVKILGQRTKAQKLAVETVKREVELYFANNVDYRAEKRT